MPLLRTFLRSGGPTRRGRASEVPGIIRAAEEVMRAYTETGARTFELARAVVLPMKQEQFKAALARAAAPRALKLPRMRQDVRAEIEAKIRTTLREPAEACTKLRCGKEVGGPSKCFGRSTVSSFHVLES